MHLELGSEGLEDAIQVPTTECVDAAPRDLHVLLRHRPRSISLLAQLGGFGGHLVLGEVAGTQPCTSAEQVSSTPGQSGVKPAGEGDSSACTASKSLRSALRMILETCICETPT